MKIYLVMIFLAAACFFIGVIIGMKIQRDYDYDYYTSDPELIDPEEFQEEFDQEQLQHVGYTPDQMGYGK